MVSDWLMVSGKVMLNSMDSPMGWHCDWHWHWGLATVMATG